jgi:hypothetical protein
MRCRYQKRLEKAREVIEQALRDLQAARMPCPDIWVSELRNGIRRVGGKCEPNFKPVSRLEATTGEPNRIFGYEPTNSGVVVSGAIVIETRSIILPTGVGETVCARGTKLNGVSEGINSVLRLDRTNSTR